MNNRNRQIILEAITYSVEAVLIYLCIIYMDLRIFAIFLICKFFVSLGNSCGWILWCSSNEKHITHR